MNGESQELLLFVLINDTHVPIESTLKWVGQRVGSKSILFSSASKGRDPTRSVRFTPLERCQESFGRKYDEQLCATLSHPFGAKIAEFEKAKLFTARRYKVITTISINEESVDEDYGEIRLCGRPNLIRKDRPITDIMAG